jgi:hypothetical protein
MDVRGSGCQKISARKKEEGVRVKSILQLLQCLPQRADFCAETLEDSILASAPRQPAFASSDVAAERE